MNNTAPLLKASGLSIGYKRGTKEEKVLAGPLELEIHRRTTHLPVGAKRRRQIHPHSHPGRFTTFTLGHRGNGWQRSGKAEASPKEPNN